jgi:Zn-dependent alcohol dehydrogenases
MKDLRLNFDLIINASSASLDIDLVLSTLTVDGALVYVGLPPEDQSFSPFSVADKRRSIAGSNTGSMAETQEMLDFCGEHGITSDVEVIDADEVDQAWDRVVASDVRYRFVIDTSSI